MRFEHPLGWAAPLAHSGAIAIRSDELAFVLLFLGAGVGIVMTLIALGLTLGMSARIRSGLPASPHKLRPPRAPLVLSIIAVSLGGIGASLTAFGIGEGPGWNGLAAAAGINFAVAFVLLRRAVSDRGVGARAIRQRYGT